MHYPPFSTPTPAPGPLWGVLARQLLNQPGMLPVKQGLRSLQTLLNYGGFRQVQQLAETLPLGPLLERQPRFAYKYLSRYSVASFSRRERLAALLHHYRFLAARLQPAFFGLLREQPAVWQARLGDTDFAITISYPQRVGYECELSLNFLVAGTLVQVLGLVVVPGQLVGSPASQALLLSQVQGTRHAEVQGTRHAELLRQATRQLHDTTPAALLVHAAYGLATALGIGAAAGVSTEEQLSVSAGSSFDYNGFWEQFRGERTPQRLYALAIPAPERPLHEIKHNHRARTLRKRRFKQELREAVADYVRTHFMV